MIRLDKPYQNIAVIFDLDGVVVNTARLHYLAWKRLANSLNIPFNQKDNKRLKGVGRMESLEYILSKGGLSPDESTKQQWAMLKNRWYVESLKDLSPGDILPGIYPLLQALKRNKIPAALASSSKNASKVVERLQLNAFFNVKIDGNMIKRSKPDPEIFLLAAKKLDIPPERCVVIEDAAAGIEAAKKAGTKTIAVGTDPALNKADLVLHGTELLHIDLLLKLFENE